MVYVCVVFGPCALLLLPLNAKHPLCAHNVSSKDPGGLQCRCSSKLLFGAQGWRSHSAWEFAGLACSAETLCETLRVQLVHVKPHGGFDAVLVELPELCYVVLCQKSFHPQELLSAQLHTPPQPVLEARDSFNVHVQWLRQPASPFPS